MMRTTRIATTLVLATACCSGLKADQPALSQMLEKGIYQEQAVGDLGAAIAIYQKIVNQHERNEAVAGQARLRLGLIHLKQGKNEKAAEVLQALSDRYPGLAGTRAKETRKLPPDLEEAIQQIRANYIDEIADRDELTDAALRGLLETLDTHSAYIDAEAMKQFRINLRGKMIGIGAVVDLEDGRLIVKSPLNGSPAAEAGLIPGDAIVAIDGVNVESFPKESRLQDSIGRLRGAAGSKVSVEIVPAGSNDSRKVEITRREVKIERMTGDHRDENNQWVYQLKEEPQIGYIRIVNFTRESNHDFQQIAESLQHKDLQGLIIDLRDNGGGMLTAAVAISDMFLDDGVILSVRGRNVEKPQYFADPDQLLPELPVVVLVNRNTASAAEILAGALKDHKRATVVGERTFGKGTVQGLFELQSGGAIKLTTARFFTPSGASLEKPKDADEDDTWGVEPSDGFAIPLSEEDRKAFSAYRSAIDHSGKPDPGQQKIDDTVLKKAVEHLKAL